jgi:hypothetical protein
MGTLIVFPKKKKRTYGKFSVSSEDLDPGSNPSPTDAELTIGAIDKGARKIMCPRQTQCVTYAASQAWTSFVCTNCSVTEKMSVDEHRYDLDGLADLLCWISS